MRYALIALIVGSSAGSLLADQRATGPTLKFEVASVKPSPPSEINADTMQITPGAFLPGGRFVARNSQLLTLIRRAYPAFSRRPGQIVGPAALLDERFDVDARASGEATNDQMVAMLQQLLSARFRLAVHVETRRVDLYELSAARSGSLGPRLRRAAEPCQAPEASRDGASPPALPQPVQPCGYGSKTINGVRTLALRGRPIAQLVIVLQNTVDRVVVDRTGLTGAFDVDLVWNVDQSLRVPADPNDDQLLLSRALNEQLGLQLRPAKGDMEVLVIDHVERPTPN
jgi:uncharacterized protein (TIGR03435 family)